MRGAEHYATAEALLANLRDEMAGSPGTPLRTREQQTQMIQEAQAHALLALTAATVDGVASRGPGDLADHASWSKAIYGIEMNHADD